MITRYARDGGCQLYLRRGELAAVSLMGMGRLVLTALCVAGSHQGTGLGTWVVGYLKPNFVRATEAAVPWFEARGYTAIGTWKKGRSLRTRVLVRSGIIGLAGRLARVLGAGPGAPPAGPTDRASRSRARARAGAAGSR